jgi:threonine/homoserine/homoserine lactone efflux protein
MLSYLILGLGYGFAAGAQPGPFQAFLLAQAVRTGWRKTLPAVCAPLLSDGPIIAFVLLVLSSLPFWWLTVLRFAGGFFLFHLAAGTYRAWRDYHSGTDRPPTGIRHTLFRAVLVNLLNPYPYLSWSLVMGPLLVTAWHDSAGSAISLLAGFYAAVLLTLAGILLLLGGSGKLSPRISRTLLGVSGLALAVFGCYQIFEASRAILPEW